MKHVFPFSAVVGQDEAKLALVLAAVDPGMGGVLLTGQKGTGKSTLVRAFPEILPSVNAAACGYNCSPENRTFCPACSVSMGETAPVKPGLVNVPLGVDEARLLGALKLDILLREGRVDFEPGLLARANNQVLYIDEVNLLPDHIADNILDCAASGINSVEKDNVSVSHPAEFILLGTMNPEEGRLRPQILDRFALSVPIRTIEDSQERIDIINRVLAFSENPEAFHSAFNQLDSQIEERILKARSKLPFTDLPLGMLGTVASAMAELGLDGQRADIVTLKAARAFAAYTGRSAVDLKCLQKVALLAVGHRTRQGGFRNAPEEGEILGSLKKGYSIYGKGSSAGTPWSFKQALRLPD